MAQTLARTGSEAGIIADIVVVDENDAWVMIVEVELRPRTSAYGKQQLQAMVAAAPASVRYGLLVTTEESSFFRRNGNGLEETALLSVPTPIVLREYDPKFDSNRAYKFYTVGLVEAWLRDVAYHWKNEAPPFSSDLTQAGIAQALYNGTTFPEVLL